MEKKSKLAHIGKSSEVTPPGSGRAKFPRYTLGGQSVPEFDEAWKQHILDLFANTKAMYRRTVQAFIIPYWTTFAMYVLLFVIGIVAFVVAIAMAVNTQKPELPLIFGGLSVTAFLTFFISQPLRALEENLEFMTWLTGIFNSYWTRLVAAQDEKTFQADVKSAADDYNRDLERLISLHAQLREKRPGLTSEIPGAEATYQKLAEPAESEHEPPAAQPNAKKAEEQQAIEKSEKAEDPAEKADKAEEQTKK